MCGKSLPSFWMMLQRNCRCVCRIFQHFPTKPLCDSTFALHLVFALNATIRGAFVRLGAAEFQSRKPHSEPHIVVIQRGGGSKGPNGVGNISDWIIAHQSMAEKHGFDYFLVSAACIATIRTSTPDAETGAAPRDSSAIADFSTFNPVACKSEWNCKSPSVA